MPPCITGGSLPHWHAATNGNYLLKKRDHSAYAGPMRAIRSFMRRCAPWLCAMWVFAASPAHAFWPFGDSGMDYAIVFDGVDEEMQAWLRELNLDKKADTNPPENLEELDAEASVLADKVKKALSAKGYMEGVAEPTLDRDAEPPVVRIAIEPGVRYPVSAIAIEWPGEPLKPLDTTKLTSKKQQPIDMQSIERDAVLLHDQIADGTCLLSLSVTPKLQLFSVTRTARVVFSIAHGASANFGAASIAGNATVRDRVIERAVAWKPGECYQQAKLDSTRTRLIENQLFASVEIEHADTPDASGQVPMQIVVKERVMRSVGAGVEFSTDQGAGVYGSWEHRNLFGEAEKLTTSLKLAERQQALKGLLRVPAFMRDDQVLALSSSLKRESLDAYEALTFEGNAGVERRINKNLKAGLGVGYTLSQTKDALAGTNNYALLSLPGFVEYDTRNDVLDPRAGLMARLSATPYTETVGDGGQFLKVLATGQHYLSNDDWTFKPTFASRLSVGAIYGAKGDNVPADIRYYAGGGGSVRGFSYQSLSPYFSGSPIGGASLIEASGELRLRFTEELGGVLFVDAGNAYASATPDFSETLYVGAGTGVRYYSPIGPLRFDIAFPLNGDDIGEDDYQFYVSLGQAF